MMSRLDASGASHRPGWHKPGYPLLLVSAALVLVTVSDGVLLSIVPSTAAGYRRIFRSTPAP